MIKHLSHLFALLLLVTAATSLQAQSTSKVVAEVNGTPIYEATVDIVIRQLESTGEIVKRQDIIDELVTSEVLRQLATQTKVNEDSEVASLLYLQEASILSSAYVEHLSTEVVVSEDEILTAFDSFKNASINWEYEASHILVDNKKKAESVLDVLDGGLDFGEAATHYSEGPTAYKKGYLGWFAESVMDPAFAEATAALEKDTYSQEPVRSNFGWHIIYLKDKRPTQVFKYEDQRDRLELELLEAKLSAKIREAINSADIDIK